MHCRIKPETATNRDLLLPRLRPAAGEGIVNSCEARSRRNGRVTIYALRLEKMERPMTASVPITPQPQDPNPLLGTWTGPGETPPFAAIHPEHFRPAFDFAMDENMAEIEEIAGNTEAASFANTIAALERSGRALSQVSAVFHALAGAHTNDAILALEREMSPRLAAHRNRIQLHGGLYARIKALWERRSELGLTGEQARVLERYEVTFRRAGAGLDPAAKQRVAEIGERLATLGTAFSQNVLADEQSYALVLETEDDLAGLGAAARDAARAAAEERGMPGKYAITLARSSIEPFLQSSTRRDLREKAFLAWIARGDGGGATDNKANIAETVRLRAERARLLGYPTFASYRLEDAMAKTPEAVRGLLRAGVEAGARPRHGRPRRAPGARPGRGRQFRPRPLGLAPLCREAPQGALRHRRGGNCALPRARRNDRKRPSTPPAACSGSPSANATMCRCGIAMSGSGRSPAPGTSSSACSSATTSPARPSAAAPG